jgi:hypothetical protein
MDAEMWISVHIVAAQCPNIEKDDFLKYMEATPGRTPKERGMNALAGAALFIRSHFKPGSWQIEACLQVAVWSSAVEIQFAVKLELEMGVFYDKELKWMRTASERPGMPTRPLFKLRELPGRLHLVWRPFVQGLVANVREALPTTAAWVVANIPESEQDDYFGCMQAGSLALQESFVKQSGFMYRE